MIDISVPFGTVTAILIPLAIICVLKALDNLEQWWNR